MRFSASTQQNPLGLGSIGGAGADAGGLPPSTPYSGPASSQLIRGSASQPILTGGIVGAAGSSDDYRSQWSAVLRQDVSGQVSLNGKRQLPPVNLPQIHLDSLHKAGNELMRTLKEKREAQHRQSINILLGGASASPLESESSKVHPVTARERLSVNGLIRKKGNNTRQLFSRSEAVIEQHEEEDERGFDDAKTTRRFYQHDDERRFKPRAEQQYQLVTTNSTQPDRKGRDDADEPLNKTYVQKLTKEIDEIKSINNSA